MFDRPIVFLDLETTGLDTEKDRIVQIAAIKLLPPNGVEYEEKAHLINPGVPIPAEATAVHGVTDAMVQDAPTFARVAVSFMKYIEGCDIAGFNTRRFDLEVLYEELARCGLTLDMSQVRAPDAMMLFYHFHPRTLEAAVQLYLGVEHKDSHDALGDTRATRDVLFAMLEEHKLTWDEAADLCDEINPIRLTPAEKWFDEEEGGHYRFRRGKHAGKRIVDVAKSSESSYLEWMLRSIKDNTVHGIIAMAQMAARGKDAAKAPSKPTPCDAQGRFL